MKLSLFALASLIFLTSCGFYCKSSGEMALITGLPYEQFMDEAEE